MNMYDPVVEAQLYYSSYVMLAFMLVVLVAYFVLFDNLQTKRKV